MSERPRRVRFFTWFALIALTVIGIFSAGSLARPEKVLPMGSPIRFDDFSFNVTEAHSSASARPGLLRYSVALSIGNQAKRVDYNFQRSAALLVTADGRVYRPVALSPGSSEPCGSPIPAGAVCDTTLVYEVPDGTVAPRFRLSFGSVGDFLERLFFGRKAIQLP
jgi:hypothetical protein